MMCQYLSDPLPSPPPKYLPSLSPTESLLWSSDGRLWLPQTSSIGSALTSSFKRFGGEGVRLSLSVDADDKPLPFDALLLVKFWSAIKYRYAINFQFACQHTHSAIATLTFKRVILGAFGIFHRRGVVVVVFNGWEIGSSYLWHVTDDIWTVIVARYAIVGSMTFQWQFIGLTGTVSFATQSGCSCSTSQQLIYRCTWMSYMNKWIKKMGFNKTVSDKIILMCSCEQRITIWRMETVEVRWWWNTLRKQSVFDQFIRKALMMIDWCAHTRIGKTLNLC